MAAAGGSIATFLVQPIVGYGLDRGIDLETMCRILDTSPAVLADPDARLSLRRCYQLWAHLGRRLREPCLPLQVVARKQVEHLRILGFLAMTSQDAWEVFACAVRYGALLRTPGEWSVQRLPNSARIVWSCPPDQPELGYRLCNEVAVAMFLRTMRLLSGTDFAAKSATFAHPAPEDTNAHVAFFGCAVEFAGAYTGFELDHAALERLVPPIPNPALAQFLSQQAAEIVARVETGSGVVGEVRAVLVAKLLEGGGDMLTVARGLGSHPRTLRRKLKAEGTSFQALLEETRREQAAELLRRPSLSITEVALLLGFSETSAFTRAFRRWFGVPPRDFRRPRARG